MIAERRPHNDIPADATGSAPAANFTGWATPNWGQNAPAGSAGRTNLSDGAIAGIVIGCLAALAVVFGIVLFLMRHQKRARRASAATLIGDDEAKETYMGRKSADEETVYGKPRAKRQDSEITCAPAYTEDPIPMYQVQQPLGEVSNTAPSSSFDASQSRT